jgi:hypothetical protein
VLDILKVGRREIWDECVMFGGVWIAGMAENALSLAVQYVNRIQLPLSFQDKIHGPHTKSKAHAFYKTSNFTPQSSIPSSAPNLITSCGPVSIQQISEIALVQKVSLMNAKFEHKRASVGWASGPGIWGHALGAKPLYSA